MAAIRVPRPARRRRSRARAGAQAGVADVLGELASAGHLLVVASFATGFVLIALSAYFWLVSLRMLDQRPRFADLTVTAARSLPARYVP